MKTFFKTIDEWVKNNPDQETINRVLNTVNRGVVSEIRKEVSEKTREVKKMQKMIKAMEEVSFPVDASITNRVKDTEKEVESLKKLLPQKK